MSTRPPSRESGGIRFRRGRPRWLVLAGAVVFLLAGSTALAAGMWTAPHNTARPYPVTTAEPSPPRAQPSSTAPATRVRTCSVAAAASDPLLGNFAASVINARTGETLFERVGTAVQSPANALQLLTAAAAYSALGPETRLTTTVVDGTTAGSIVLVGGGDPTLASTSGGVYPAAPRLADLATAAMAQYLLAHPGVPVTTIVLDATLWPTADTWDSSWPASERTDGYLPFITALMVDGDRADPTQAVSARGEDPVGRAGQAFAAAAGLSGVTFTRGTVAGTTVLATVSSQPVRTLISQMLMASDNALAEALARAVSLKQGRDGSSASLSQAIPAALGALGLTGVDALTIRDGSGESADSVVPTAFLADMMVKVARGQNGLGVLFDSLPVGGVSGALSDRFSADTAAAGAATHAASGWIFRQRTLVGAVTAADATILSFAFYALGEGVTVETRGALDTLTAAIYRCGDNLSSH